MGLVPQRHVGSSRTRDRTHVPCIGKRILNHCATREVLLRSSYANLCSFSLKILPYFSFSSIPMQRCSAYSNFYLTLNFSGLGGENSANSEVFPVSGISGATLLHRKVSHEGHAAAFVIRAVAGKSVSGMFWAEQSTRFSKPQFPHLNNVITPTWKGWPED